MAQRLASQGGDPVVQLQTAFGGGKTHTLLAVYHLASRSVPTSQLSGIPPLLDEAGIAELPKARVAVIDGIKLSPSQSRTYGQQTINTLWGELAWQSNTTRRAGSMMKAPRGGYCQSPANLNCSWRFSSRS